MDLGQFDDARLLDQFAYDLLLGDWPRAQNRVKIANLANGVPPYDESEVESQKIVVNVNDLSMTRVQHDARAQFYNGILKPGKFFSAKTDAGPAHKRSQWNTAHTAAVNRQMKRSIGYFEALRSKFGLLTLHGISPAIWENRERWRPRAIGVEDALIPSQTLLGFENLPFFMVKRSFTGLELSKLALGAKPDPGWNVPMVKACLRYCDDALTQLWSTQWPDMWSPEKWAERMKQDGRYYASDQCPTIDCFDVYGWSDEGGEEGWVRRIILDSWSVPDGVAGARLSAQRREKRPRKGGGSGADFDGENDFLYSSGSRRVAMNWQQIASFQFADLSAVAPFRYHSVRSLGFLLYSVCQLQNRMRCRFNEAVFEALCMLFRVKSEEDIQRALQVNIGNRMFVDSTIQTVPAAERWQPNAQLIELGIKENSDLINQHSSLFTQPQHFSKDKTEKTKFQVMAEVNNASAMVGAALNQAYRYLEFEYREIDRRFLIKNSGDPEVRSARAEMLKAGIPEKYLEPECWDIEPERIMGAGNKTMEMVMAEQLLGMRQLFDPEPQRVLLRDVVLAITDNLDKAMELVPEKPAQVTDSTHDADLAMGVLMQGMAVGIKTGINHIEYVEEMLRQLIAVVGRYQKQGGMAPPDKIMGFQNVAQHLAAHIKIIGQDPAEKARVKKYGEVLGKIMNMVKAFAQRLQKAQQAQAKRAGAGNGGLDPKDAAKIKATMTMAQTKAQLAKQSHAQRTAQRDIQFQEQLKHDKEAHEADMAALDLQAASEIRRQRFSSLEDEQ